MGIEDLQETLRAHDFYLNLHKGCVEGGPVTFRSAILLSARKLVLSARCYPRDEAEYNGMIRFEPLERIPAAFRELSESGRGAWSRRAELAHLRFRERFEPRQLLQRAAVYLKLAGLLGKPQPQRRIG